MFFCEGAAVNIKKFVSKKSVAGDDLLDENVINEKDETLMIIYNWCVISIESDGYMEVDLYQTTLNFVLIEFLNEFRKNADKIYSS